MIYNVLPVNNYSGNNLNTKFDFDFYIENEKQLKVNLFDENNTKIELKYNLDYSINEFKNENGSYIIFPLETSLYSVLDEKQKISLELNLPIIQQTRYNNSSLLNLSSLEYSFDYLTRLVQILARKLDLTVRVEECSTVSPNELLDNINDSKLVCTQKASIAVDSANFAAEIKEYLNDTKSLLLDNKNITNCITELPQNIKLDLADGILTLKAGSIVTIPNGFEDDGVTPKFDYVTIENDKTMPSETTTAAQRMCWVALSAGGYANGVVQWCFSGNTSLMNSTAPNAYSTFYNTEINKMYRGNGTVWEEQQFSLPICLATNDSSGQYVSIDQIFNGFGYIGSTVWVDKGIKGLIPNGRNEDGTLNNIEFVTNAVHTQTFTASNTVIDNSYWIISSGELGGFNANIKYHGDINKVLYDVDNTIRLYCEIGRCSLDKGIITSFQAKQPFQALDYNDKPEISHWSMPSNKTLYLTLGASGSLYTAPANGWFSVHSTATMNGMFNYEKLSGATGVTFTSYSSLGGRGMLPVSKGDVVKFSYTGTPAGIRFIYARGEV